MFKNILIWLRRVEGAVAALAFVMAAGAVLSDVVAREIFASSLWGATKFAVFCAAVAGFLGIGLATDNGMHLRPSFADGLVPAGLEPAMARLAPWLTAGFYFAAAWVSYLYVRESYEFGQAAPVLDWPLWIIQVVMPYAFLSNGIRQTIYGIDPRLAPETAGLF
ncbi:TRAP transporter small permease [Chachezhania sediminis]|uniref:TRAP transporter small permease n=1 Tax=Chachezhania sediminis TaxID=2599291 RepID=UPI00131BD492|nr:TRAP transporter small permease subunit [Chachezhania sediminis]